LAKGRLVDAHLEVVSQGRRLQEIKLPTRSVRQTMTWFLAALTVLVPCLLFYVTVVNPVEQVADREFKSGASVSNPAPGGPGGGAPRPRPGAGRPAGPGRAGGGPMGPGRAGGGREGRNEAGPMGDNGPPGAERREGDQRPGGRGGAGPMGDRPAGPAAPPPP